MSELKNFPLAILWLFPVISGFFGKSRSCEREQYGAYGRLGETLANTYADKLVSYNQLVNTTALITGNATFEPLCMRNLVYSYQYYLQKKNIPSWRILLPSLERTALAGKSNCQCNVENTIFYFTEDFEALGENPSKEAIDSILEAFGYLQYPDWYSNCYVLESYLYQVVQQKKYKHPGRLEKEKIQQIRLTFEQGGIALIRPLLLRAIEKQDSLLPIPFKTNQSYCFMYNSSARIFAKKNDTLGDEPVLFLLETVKNETGNFRMDALCLNSFLEEYSRQSERLGTPAAMFNMLEGLYRTDQRFSTVTDYDKCKCRIPSLSRKLVGELIEFGASPNETLWNDTMKKYYYLPRAIAYQSCPILERYLEIIAQKYGVQTAERRFLEVGFEIVKVLYFFPKEIYLA